MKEISAELALFQNYLICASDALSCTAAVVPVAPVPTVSYGNIAGLPAISAGHDLWVFAAGNIGGVFYAGNCVQFCQSDGSIQANITAGSGTPTGEGDYGVVGYDHPVTAWGNVAGTITAATSINVDAGGSVSATLTAPAADDESITQNDAGVIGSRPVLGDVGQAALASRTPHPAPCV